MKTVLGVIPARLGSERLPRKPLADVGGKPLIYYTYQQAKKTRLLDEVVVATDSREIYDAVEGFGGRAVMTAPDHKTGSDRVGEAVRIFMDFTPDIVVNVQGDEPVIDPAAIDATVEALRADADAAMATVATPLTRELDLDDPNVVKVVLDNKGRALYFSRYPVPYRRNPVDGLPLRHIGIFTYRRPFLDVYLSLPQTPLEIAESLEQLRVLQHGHVIAVAVGQYFNISVDTAMDLERAREIIRLEQRAQHHG